MDSKTCKVPPPWGLVFWGFLDPQILGSHCHGSQRWKGIWRLPGPCPLSCSLVTGGLRGDWPPQMRTIGFFLLFPNCTHQARWDLGQWKSPGTCSDQNLSWVTRCREGQAGAACASPHVLSWILQSAGAVTLGCSGNSQALTAPPECVCAASPQGGGRKRDT